MSVTLRRIYVAEPPPQYLSRLPIVVDCSMICAVLFDEPERADAEERLARRHLLAPCLLDHEVVNVALKKGRRGMPVAALERALFDYGAQDIEFVSTVVPAQHALAERYGLSAYDAAYLWLAAERKVPLATFDRKLGEAAQRHLGALE
jgi:predicted nucleic acid-binding protein